MWAHCSLTPWTSQNWRESSSLPQGAFNTRRQPLPKPRGVQTRKNPILFSFFFLAELQLILMRRPNMTSWKESRRNLAALAARAAEGAPISFSACLSQKWISWYPYRHTRTSAKMNEMLVLRPHWELIGGGRLFVNSLIETLLSVL